MQGRNRILRVDVCDYTNTVLCNLYDNAADLAGQATDVFIKYERNGWKELRFSLPSVIHDGDRDEENYRLQYMIADYRLRAVTDKGPDWYLITEESVRHEAFSNKETITAGHISQLLKNRAMDLEFADTEGNNVGTAGELLATILENTGWKPGKVAAFYEDDCTTIKRRSLNASEKTGAFRLIEQVCELFEAKPVYNGDRTVDILPMNPFSKLEPGEIPEAVYPGAEENEKYLVDSNVIELHYDREIKNLERKKNTENISTRLYAYGSYGDNVSKYCSLQTATHEEYVYIVSDTHRSEYQITDSNGAVRYFTAYGLKPGQKLIWSMLDPNSRRYVWNDDLGVAYKVYDTSKFNNFTQLTGEIIDEINYFPYLSDYTYYEKVGLLTDEMFQKVAAFQRNMAAYYKAAIAAQEQINTVSEQLSNTGIPKSGYLKLDIESCEQRQDGTVLTLRWSDEHPDGVIYRSDYLQTERNWFRWDVAQALKSNGDPISSTASVIYVLKDTEPVQWSFAYLKDIDGRQHTDVDGHVIHDGYDYKLSEGEKPHVLTLWSALNVEEGDSVYLFCTNSTSGRLGELFSEDEAAMEALENRTMLATEKHPTLFVDYDEPLPEITFTSYGWCYQYNSSDYDTPGTLYFSWPARNDVGWKRAYVQDETPDIDSGAYFYSTRYRTLWHCEDEWVKLETVDDTYVAGFFGIVFQNCRIRDKVHKGVYENYFYDTDTVLPVGNYAMPTAFGYYWVFTTDMEIEAGGQLRLDTVKRYIYQDDNVEHIITPHCYPYDLLVHAAENELLDATFFEGSIYTTDPSKAGTDMASDRAYRSNFISVWPNETYEYNLPDESFAVLYDANRNFIGYVGPLSGEGEFSTTVDEEYSEALNSGDYVRFKKSAYMKVVIPKEGYSEETACVRLKNYDKCFFFDDVRYDILEPVTHDDGEPIGIMSMIRRFMELTDALHLGYVPALKDAQKRITDENADQLEVLGDILREGWWQDGSYVAGDEQRMYKDAYDNMVQVSQPDTEYTFDFLDLYGSQDMSIRDLREVEWPDIEITDAAHLIDPGTGTNCWAYIDELDKCFDQPWKTTITVNTKLTLIGQHEFKDVMTRIAEVASETKAKQTLYRRAEAITADGTIDGGQITGGIDVEEVQLTGRGMHTDEHGNLIFESGDGLAAMRFNGSGLAMANSKNADGDWEWRNMGNGFGLSADAITTGELNGRLVRAHSIRADSLMANVGNELDIGSNRALNLFATADGLRPSGALKTPDSMIEIKAGDDETKAAINIGTGGELNLMAGVEGEKGSSINIGSQGKINMSANSSINIESDSAVNISGGKINLSAGSTFTVESNNFGIDKRGNVTLGGTISSPAGAILGGWHISDNHIGNAATVGNSSVGLQASENAQDVVLWAGNSNKAHAPFKVKANGAVESSDMHITGGSFTLSEIVNEQSVDNIIIDNNGLRIGHNNAGGYNFTVTSNGEAVATGLIIKNGQITEGSSLSNGTITNGTITGGTITGGAISSGTINGTTINACAFSDGEIHIRPENEQDETFSVDSTGATTIRKGSICLGTIVNSLGNVTGYNFSVDDNGEAILKSGSIEFGPATETVTENDVEIEKITGYFKADENGIAPGTTIGGFRIDSDGNLMCDNGTDKDKFFLMASPDVDNETLVDYEDYLMWSGSDTPTSDGCVFRIRKTGAIKCKSVTTTDTATTSSREVKRFITPLEHRDAFDEIEPVSFQYKDSEETHFGVIYEDMVRLYPEVCRDGKDGKAVAYTDLIAVLIKEVQDLRKRVAELERK